MAASLPAPLVIVGAGKMGTAVLRGLLASGFDAASVTLVNPGAERCAELSARHGVAAVERLAGAPEAKTVILAVKPQVMRGVLEECAALPWAAGALFVTVAAGLPTSLYEEILPAGARVVRTMPNTALVLEGHGVIALCRGASASADDLEAVRAAFAAFAQALVVEERHMDVVGAISGSGPAYAARLVESLAAAGEAQGLERGLAESLAAWTLMGAGALMARAGQSAERTRLDVCSPNGTTLAALAAMADAGFERSVEAGVEAAVRRSKELAS